MSAEHSIVVWTAGRNRWIRVAAAKLALTFALGMGACGGDAGSTVAVKSGATGKASAEVAPTQPARAVATPVSTGGDSTMAGGRILQPEPPSTPVTYEEAEAVFRKGDYAEAARLFASYTGAKPDNAWGYYMLGLSEWKSGDRGRAIDALSQAVELAPDNVKARTNLGRVLLEEGRAEEAVPHLEHALDVAPESAAVWRVMGNLRAELGDGDQAADDFRHALTLDAEDEWSMNNLGLLMIRRGQYAEALAPLARAVELEPGSPVFQNNLGIALERGGFTAEAAEAYRAAMAVDSTYRKAAVSLERVEPLVANSRLDAPDLVALARSFEEQVRGWTDTVVASSREPGS